MENPDKGKSGGYLCDRYAAAGHTARKGLDGDIHC